MSSGFDAAETLAHSDGRLLESPRPLLPLIRSVKAPVNDGRLAADGTSSQSPLGSTTEGRVGIPEVSLEQLLKPLFVVVSN